MKSLLLESKAISDLRFALLVLIPIMLAGCGGISYELWDQRLEPTYVCEGENINVVATWKYSGPKAKAKVISGNEAREILGEAGVRSGRCELRRPLTQDDPTLKIKIFRKGKKKGGKNLFYEVLSGPENTE